ncbi:MAG: hypothetical protein STHCBS139747_003245 [Sporothrix thermara]
MHHHETAVRTSSRGAPNDTEESLSASNSSEPATWTAFNNIIDIEDDDLMFGGKPLCTWYEEDRRCSMSEESRHHSHGHSHGHSHSHSHSHGHDGSNAPSPESTGESLTDEDEERGRRRDRPQYHVSKPHKKH